MPRRSTLAAVAMLAFAVTRTASAAPLHYDGILYLELGGLPFLNVVGGGVATVNGAGGLGHLNDLRLRASRGGISTPSAMLPVTNPTASPIKSLQVQAELGTGTLGPISGAVQSTTVLGKNVLPIAGLAKICLLSTACTLFLPLELTQHTAGTGTKGIGIGGLLTVGAGGPLRISIQAAPWTLKTATLIDQITLPTGGNKYILRKAVGFAHGPSTNTSSTANPSGVVQLITPMQIATNLSNGSNLKVSMFGFLTIQFVPEPGMLPLLGSGIAGLFVLGRSRMRP